MKNSNVTVAIMSYEIWKHPRALKIAKTLLKHGFNVKLWGSRKPVKKGPRILKGILNYIFAFFEVLTVEATIFWVENVPDLIFLPLFILKRKVVYDRRSPWAKQVLFETGNTVLYKIAEIVERYILKKAEHIVVVSTPMKYEYEKTRKAEVIPNFPEKSFIKENTANIRAKFKLNSKTKVLTYVGKLSLIEGAPILLKVIKKLCNRYAGLAELWIIGDGPGRKMIEEYSKKCNNIRFFGWIKRSEIGDFIASSDYGLVPRFKNFLSVFYNHEGIHKIGEYLAYWKPVIACGLSPSKYYLNVEPERYSDTIEDVILGKIEIKAPKHYPLWEEVSEKKVVKIVSKVVQGEMA